MIKQTARTNNFRRAPRLLVHLMQRTPEQLYHVVAPEAVTRECALISYLLLDKYTHLSQSLNPRPLK